MLPLQRRNLQQYNLEYVASEEDVINKSGNSVCMANVNESKATSMQGGSATEYEFEGTCSLYAGMEDKGGKPEDFRAYGGHILLSGMKECKTKKILFKEESLVFGICNERRLIKERRNAVCEMRPHDRHELCAKLRQGIVLKGLEI